jgi:hypothetical protein
MKKIFVFLFSLLLCFSVFYQTSLGCTREFVWDKKTIENGGDVNKVFNRATSKDGSGNICTSAIFSDSVTIDVNILTSEETQDCILANYNWSGSLAWTKRIGGSGSYDISKIQTDENINSYITDHLEETFPSGHSVFSCLYPTALAATSLDCNSFIANWNVLPVNGSEPFTYKLDVAKDAGFTNFVPGFQNITVTGNSKVVTGLTLGFTYYYRVRATTSTFVSCNSNTIVAVLSNPSGFSVDFTTGKALCTTPFTSVVHNPQSLQVRSYQWDFGDNTTSTELHPIHIYASGGTYQVTLTVTYQTPQCASLQTASRTKEVVISSGTELFEDKVFYYNYAGAGLSH